MISVVIPTFNRMPVLERALKSVLNQSYQASQIIIVDDGSSDGTCDLISQNYPMVDYYFQNNQGVSSARNLGIQQSKFPWIALLDSDDKWLPNKCSILRFDPVKRLSTQTTSCPISIRRSIRCEPKKPAPPVTRILLRV